MTNPFDGRRAWIIGTGVLLIALCAFGAYFGPQIHSYLAIRARLRQAPAFPRGWDSVPQALTDNSSLKIGGMTLSNYGYTFEVPWNEVTRAENPGDYIETDFKTGQTVRFVNPGLLRLTYRRFQDVIAIVPSQISPFSSHRRFAGDLELLDEKGSMFEHNPVAPEISSFQTPSYRGFELRYVTRQVDSVELYLFGADDHEIELTVSTARDSNAHLSQSEINRIIQTFAVGSSKSGN
jgi:hypothetical protein